MVHRSAGLNGPMMTSQLARPLIDIAPKQRIASGRLAPVNKTVWPSGLRCWLQAPVRKGVGSNPTAVIAIASHQILFGKIWEGGKHTIRQMQQSLQICFHNGRDGPLPDWSRDAPGRLRERGAKIRLAAFHALGQSCYGRWAQLAAHHSG